MFCPRCGCLLPDDATVCKECGHHIGKNVRVSLHEEQPAEAAVRKRSTGQAYRYRGAGIAGVFLSLLALIVFFLPWLSGTGWITGVDQYSGLTLLTEQPSLGRSTLILTYVPLLCALAGVIGTGLFVFGRRHRSLTLALGMSMIALTVFFCLALGTIGIAAGISAYLTIICGLGIAVASAFDFGRSV